MSIPAFTAQASLYRTSNRYRCVGVQFGGSKPLQSVVAAYIPGPETQNKCSGCDDGCAVSRNICLTKVGVTAAESCLGTGIFFPLCLAGEIAFLTPTCYAAYSACLGYCNIPGGLGPFSGPCCPKVCGPPTPGVSGSGCCDHGEACVGSGSPNTRDGCCPVGRYCGGNCCAEGESCCGNTCCPPNFFCLDGDCTEFPPFTPPGGNPPPPPPNNCIFGGAPCGPKCCPPGLECCSYSVQFGADCKTSCLH